MSHKKYIVMLGTSPDTMGGISAVVKVYRDAGLFERYPVMYLATHCDGSASKKMRIGVTTWIYYLHLLMRGQVNLVHVHTASNISFWRKTAFLVPAFACRVPTILHLHGGGFQKFYEKRSGIVAKWIIRTIYERVDNVIVLSNTWKTWVQTIAKNSHIAAIYNAVKLPPAVDIVQRDSASILCLGRLGKSKGTYDLLAAVSNLIQHHPNLKLYLGGDGELEQVRMAACNMGIGAHVIILGWVGAAEKSALLARATVFTLPSYAEGLPMSLLEAMAAGIPVVATPVGGVPEAVEQGLEGFLVQPGDVNLLSVALDRLLSDPALRQRMGVAAREKVTTTFATENVLPQIEKLYQELGVQPCPTATHLRTIHPI